MNAGGNSICQILYGFFKFSRYVCGGRVIYISDEYNKKKIVLIDNDIIAIVDGIADVSQYSYDTNNTKLNFL